MERGGEVVRFLEHWKGGREWRFVRALRIDAWMMAAVCRGAWRDGREGCGGGGNVNCCNGSRRGRSGTELRRWGGAEWRKVQIFDILRNGNGRGGRRGGGRWTDVSGKCRNHWNASIHQTRVDFSICSRQICAINETVAVLGSQIFQSARSIRINILQTSSASKVLELRGGGWIWCQRSGGFDCCGRGGVWWFDGFGHKRRLLQL